MQPLLLPGVIYLILQLMKHNSISRCILLNAFQLFSQCLSFVFCYFVRTDSYFTVTCFSFFLHSPRESGEGKRRRSCGSVGTLAGDPGSPQHPSRESAPHPLPAAACSGRFCSEEDSSSCPCPRWGTGRDGLCLLSEPRWRGLGTPTCTELPTFSSLYP